MDSSLTRKLVLLVATALIAAATTTQALPSNPSSTPPVKARSSYFYDTDSDGDGGGIDWQQADTNDNSAPYGADQQQQQQQCSNRNVLDIKFSTQFQKFDPRSDTSYFTFGPLQSSSGSRTDNAAFLRHDGLVDMVTLPFAHWFPQNTTGDVPGVGQTPLTGFALIDQLISPARAVYDASASLKQPLTVASGEVLKLAYKFTCKTLNTKEVARRFPPQAILNYKDDPRMATCAIALSEQIESGVEFAFHATSNGVWAKYTVNALGRLFTNASYDTFDIYRRVGSRASVDEIIDSRIEIDRREHRKEARFYLNDKLVWRVYNLGVFSENLFSTSTGTEKINSAYGAAAAAPVNRLVSYSSGAQPRTTGADPGIYQMYVANIHKMDEADPNRMDDGKQYSPGLIRLTTYPGFYGRDITFWDELSLRYNSLAGQGAISGMERLTVTVCDAAQNSAMTTEYVVGGGGDDQDGETENLYV